MKILCELKRCKETVSRGRFSGQETEYALVVGGDNYSWNISRNNLNADTPPIGQKFFKGFSHLMGYFAQFGIEDNAVDVIVDALEKNTGQDATELRKQLEEREAQVSLAVTGKLIDNFFRCNYNNEEHNSGKLTDPDRIYVRVLRANVKTAEKESA